MAYVGAAIDQHGGFIDRYIGNAVMALFDKPHTDGALGKTAPIDLYTIGLSTHDQS
jgi:class 3 adenylate cyclase